MTQILRLADDQLPSENQMCAKFLTLPLAPHHRLFQPSNLVIIERFIDRLSCSVVFIGGLSGDVAALVIAQCVVLFDGRCQIAVDMLIISIGVYFFVMKLSSFAGTQLQVEVVATALLSCLQFTKHD